MIDHVYTIKFPANLIDSEDVTLTRIQFPKKDTVRLIPANKNMQAKEYLAKRVVIQGILVGQVRVYD